MRLTSIAVALSLLVLPRAASAQLTSDGGQDAGWPPVAIGVRIGWDNAQQGEMLGALVRVPVFPNGSVELVPNADMTFLPGIKEYQVNLDAVYVTAGRRGGLYVGGGVGSRNSRYSPDPAAPRRNDVTLSIVAGARLGGPRFRPELEVRWILQTEYVRAPRPAMIGLTVALW